MKTHKDLQVWQKAMELVKEVYLITRAIPKEELYGLTSQMRRAAVSIPSNVAEGAARASKKEFIQFLYIALGSLSELETQWLLAKEMKMIKKDPEPCIEPVRRLLLGLIRSLKAKKT
jgi:four helix bundle protein